jgi:uncharacterized protein (TIGR02996 family)
MSEGAGFLRAIIADGDDTHRLVYADWLDDHGDADRAAFIRAQVRLAQTGPGDEGHDELKVQEQRLLARHGAGWLEPVRPFLHPAFKPEDVEKLGVFRRGFVETAFVDAGRFLSDPGGLFAAAPVSGLIFWVRGLSPALLGCAGLGRAARLRFMSWTGRVCGTRERNIELSSDDVLRLSEGRLFEAVRELDLTGQRVTPVAVAALVRSPRWAGLETLKLGHGNHGPGCFAALGSVLALPRLRRLHLNSNRPGALEGLRGAAWLRRLDTLDLGGCELNVEDVAAFFGEGEWPALEDLNLWAMHGGDSGGRLADALRRMPRLRTLGLSWRHFAEPLRPLTQGGFETLHSLNVMGGFQRDSSGLFPTAAFPNLRDLDVSANRLTGQLAGLADSALARSLRRLNLGGCKLSDAEILSFARTARMPELETLHLGESSGGFKPKTLAALEFGDGFPRLRTLYLRISAPGLAKQYEALAAAPAVRQVKYLHLHGGSLTSKLIDLLTGHPGFQVVAGLGLGVPTNLDNRRRLRDHFGDRLLE